MATQQQLTLPRKVKLKLIQPAIKCYLRNDVESYYRGKIVREDDNYYYIEFKYNKIARTAQYDKQKDSFIDPVLFDIKIVK